ncbi:MAG: aminotransferase class V-fold PLP-dependent enzyme [Phycisphaerales bacterium]|nr:aminotransferase class V-fold PLP-dependent enzyme [Planctomycetota bacterium]
MNTSSGQHAVTEPATSGSAAPADRVSRIRFQTSHWDLDPAVTFLNHGSYGATPRAVLEAQNRMRARTEREPVRFYKVDLERLMDGVREVLGSFINCDPTTIAPVPNATMGIASIFSSTPFKAGDEILLTDHEYQSGINELERMAKTVGVKVVLAPIPFPIRSQDEVFEAVMRCVTPRTKLAMISQITSGSSLIFPVERLVPALKARGIDVIVDGAHGPGQIPVDLRALAPTYYVGSLHKWLSAPKGTAFLSVSKEKQATFRPVFLSSRANKIRHDRDLFLRDFDYHGTLDYSGFLVVPEAIAYISRLLPGGWPELYRRNHEMVVKGREIVCRAIGAEPPCPDSMLGSMASIILPEPAANMKGRPSLYDDPLQDALIHNHGVVTPIWRVGGNDRRIIRISAQAYNTLDQYETLAEALVKELRAEGSLPANSQRKAG